MSERRCPDGGKCHHDCLVGCWRVGNAGPLSDVYPNDEWPESVTGDLDLDLVFWPDAGHPAPWQPGPSRSWRFYVRKKRWWERIIRPRGKWISQFKWTPVPDLPEEGEYWVRITFGEDA